MFDLYALPSDFPGVADVRAADPYRHVERLEAAMAADLADDRLVPYLQLHEFEALLLSAPEMLAAAFPKNERAGMLLARSIAAYRSPELVNEDESPSKRIIDHLPKYGSQKASAGPQVAGLIGLATLRLKCRHFGDWLAKLEGLGNRQQALGPGQSSGSCAVPS